MAFSCPPQTISNSLCLSFFNVSTHTSVHLGKRSTLNPIRHFNASTQAKFQIRLHDVAPGHPPPHKHLLARSSTRHHPSGHDRQIHCQSRRRFIHDPHLCVRIHTMSVNPLPSQRLMSIGTSTASSTPALRRISTSSLQLFSSRRCALIWWAIMDKMCTFMERSGRTAFRSRMEVSPHSFQQHAHSIYGGILIALFQQIWLGSTITSSTARKGAISIQTISTTEAARTR